MFALKVVDLIRPFVRSSDVLNDPELISEILCQEAEKLSIEPAYLSPFAKAAHRYNYDYMGGKSDDITVVVAQVKLDN